MATITMTAVPSPRPTMSARAILRPKRAIAQRRIFLMAKVVPTVKVGRSVKGCRTMPIRSAITGAVIVILIPTVANAIRVVRGSISADAQARPPATASPGANEATKPREATAFEFRDLDFSTNTLRVCPETLCGIA